MRCSGAQHAPGLRRAPHELRGAAHPGRCTAARWRARGLRAPSFIACAAWHARAAHTRCRQRLQRALDPSAADLLRVLPRAPESEHVAACDQRQRNHCVAPLFALGSHAYRYTTRRMSVTGSAGPSILGAQNLRCLQGGALDAAAVAGSEDDTLGALPSKPFSRHTVQEKYWRTRVKLPPSGKVRARGTRCDVARLARF